MNLFQRIFLLIGKVVRLLPSLRGKVGLANRYYKYFGGRRSEEFVTRTSLFRENLIFDLNLNCAHERMAYLMGHYEDETTSFLLELWEGGVLLDVGANIGLISIPFVARMKEYSSTSAPFVYAVEAMQSNFQALCNNIELNNLELFVSPVNIGLGAKEGEAFIEIEGDNPQRTGTANILPNARDAARTGLRIRSIDAMTEEGKFPDNISLIKIDTDGYDFEVLKGARAFLTANRPLVFAELAEHCLNWHGYGIKEVIVFLDELDYQVWPLRGLSPPRFAPDVDSDYQINCLLVPRERMPGLAHYLV